MMYKGSKWTREGTMMGGHYDVDAKDGNYDVQIKVHLNRGHYDLQKKGWMDKGGLYDVERQDG